MYNIFLTNYEKQELITSFTDTLFLLIISGIFIISIGLTIGLILFYTEKNKPKTHKIIGIITDTFRSIPFVILMILLIPVTIFLLGTMIGAKAALPSLILSASPFYARLVYNALREIDRGNLEALDAMGCQPMMKTKYILKESLPSLISGLTITLVTLVGFIAASGPIGAGGLGDYAKRKAFAGEYGLMSIGVILILIIVFTLQLSGDFIVKKIDKR